MAAIGKWRLGVLLLACGSPAALAQGQPQSQQSPPPGVQDKEGISVTGQRMPAAEAPRSATCEVLSRDPYFAALVNSSAARGVLGPKVYVPTRFPRNPDYSATPLFAAGSPLPVLPKTRFGMRDIIYASEGISAASSIADSSAPGGVVAEEASAATDVSDMESAIATCREAYRPGGAAPANIGPPTGADNGSTVFTGPTSGAAGRVDGRATIVRNDDTLPMGFALFDQGRYAEALDWFHRAFDKLQFAEGGDEAALFIGKINLLGLGDRSNAAEAVKWLKKAATGPFNPVLETPLFDPAEPERNTAPGEAAVILGNVYRTGFGGVARDPEEARKWFERAFDVGHVAAAKMLGDLYYDGIGTPRDAKKAASWYRRAAKLGLPAAEFALAQILFDGDTGVGQDRKEALDWYQAAARADHAGALYALGRAYDLGEGVAADPQMAIGFYKSAALKGNAAAMVSMGTYFYQGELVAKDHDVARSWFEQGAARSDADGMFNLAAMMMRGEGGPKDLVKAWGLLKRAAALGHPQAPRAVVALERQMSDEQKLAANASLSGR